MVGAILTQNTSWANVEKAIECLKREKALDCETLLLMRKDRLARLIRSSGYFNVKAERLKNYCQWYSKQSDLEGLSDNELRTALLNINGIGPETADDIVLYAFQRPVFVIDAYTKRLWKRLGQTPEDDNYESWRSWFEKKLTRTSNKVAMFNQYHALIVHHAKNYCKARQPHCGDCCLANQCDFFKKAQSEN